MIHMPGGLRLFKMQNSPAHPQPLKGRIISLLEKSEIISHDLNKSSIPTQQEIETKAKEFLDGPWSDFNFKNK